MLRNRELLVQLVVCELVTVAVAALAWTRVPTGSTFVNVFASGTVVALVTCAFTLRRYRRLAELARQIDRVLAGERDVSFDDMNEGELSILASQLAKTLSRLHVANDQLDAEKRALADSLADISHQLRTPLTSLGLQLALIRRDAQSQAHLSRIRNAESLLERVQWLVSSLLKLARLDAGVVSLESRRVEVAGLVEAAFQPLAVSFDLSDVAFETDIAPGAGFDGDASWTREALSNVLKNCLEHTDAAGAVRVEAWEDAIACRIRVTDTGCGIDEADLPHVFERFYRGGAASASSEVNPAGVGIGLSLAQALVAAQGGAITASNVIDEAGRVAGACFEFTFFKTVV